MKLKTVNSKLKTATAALPSTVEVSDTTGDAIHAKAGKQKRFTRLKKRFV